MAESGEREDEGGREEEKRSELLFRNILFKRQTASRWWLKGVWSCLFPTLAVVGCFRCCCYSPRQVRAPPLPAPTHFPNAASSGVKGCWADGEAGRSSHLWQKRRRGGAVKALWRCAALCLCTCVCVKPYQPVPALRADHGC